MKGTVRVDRPAVDGGRAVIGAVRGDRPAIEGGRAVTGTVRVGRPAAEGRALIGSVRGDRPGIEGGRAVIGSVRVDLPAARRLLCWYGAYALLAPRLPAPTCPLRRLTGRRCPACGLTTAVAAALRGRGRHAATLHPLGPVTAAAVLAAGVTTVTGAVRRPVAAPRHGVGPVAAAASWAGAEAADRGRAR